MTQLTDEDLGDLLTEAFAAHEHLADPDLAVAIASAPGRPRHRGRVLLAAAAAVALVAVGTSYVVTRGSEQALLSDPDHPGPTTVGDHEPPLPPLETDAENRAAAVREADRVAAVLAAYPGAHETDAAGVPELDDTTLSSVHPQGHTVVRSRFWTVSGATASGVAHWYAAHPPAGFRSGGRNAVGGQGDGRTWIYGVDDTQPGVDQLTGSGTSVELQTTKTPAGVGVRATVSTVWLPARPVASFVQDVSSIDVRSTHARYGRQVRRTHRSFTVSAAADMLRAAVAFNDLPGMTPIPLPCPMMRDLYTDRIVFHTATGDVSAVGTSSACGSGMVVRRDGHLVSPQLGAASTLRHVLGLHH